MNIQYLVRSAVLAFLLGIGASANAALIAHWKFDDANGTSAIDSIGKVNGTLVGGVTLKSTGGVRGGALQVNDGYVDMGENFSCKPTFTVQAWIKIQAGNTSGMIPVAKHWSTIMQGYFLSINNIGDGYTQTNTVGFYTADGSYKTAIGGPSVNDDGWHQLVGIYNNGKTSIYIDGNLAGTGSAGCGNNSAHFLIGGYTDSNGKPINFFKGLIDEVQVYDDALSADDVKALYNAIRFNVNLVSCVNTVNSGAYYNNGKLTINSVEVSDGLGGTIKYKTSLSLKPFSDPLTFILDNAERLE